MREIKFRAYHKELNVILNVYVISQTTNALGYTRTCHGYYGDNIQVQFAFDEVIWIEYTGLKDKNGKDIYEGDVVNHDSSIWPCKIIYKRKIAQFMAKEIKKNGELGKVWQISEKKIISVVGNIYENPELLK